MWDSALKHAEVPIHTNASENALRPIALGRRNWMFVGSPKGGEVATRFNSLVNTCKALEVNPFENLTDILERVATTPASQIASLPPWAWKKRRSRDERGHDN